MKEISFFNYIKGKDVKIGQINIDNNLQNKILFTEFKNILLNPRLWSVITNDFYIFNDFERYLSQHKHYKEIILKHNEIEERSKNISKIKGDLFLFGAENNYWHFLIDFIPRLVCLKYLTDRKIVIIISKNLSHKFLYFVEKICYLLNIKEVNLIRIDQEKLIYSFENLIFTSRPSIEFSSSFLHKILNKSITKNKSKNLYVKRGNTTRRKVLNEDKVIKFIKEYNYEIINCFELTIEEQIRIFSQAKNIVIPSGAAMANLIFVPDDINVIEIRSNLDGDYSKKINLKNRFNLYFFDKTTKVGNELRKDIIVDLDELKKIIEVNKIF